MLKSQAVLETDFRILVLAPNSWYGQWVNRQQLFSRLARTHSVLYTTGGWFTWDRHSPDWREASWAGNFSLHDNVWVDDSPRALMRVPKLRALDIFATRLQCLRWKRFINRTGQGPLIAYVFHPMFHPYVKFIGAKYVVYHAYDLYEHTPGWNATLDEYQRRLLHAADLVVASSDQISDGLRASVARHVQVLPNGADVDAFKSALESRLPEPKDLASIPHPRLGWVGSLHPQVDFALIYELASRQSELNIVLVGQVVDHSDARAEAERIRCMSLKNVHFLGAKTIEDVPQYLVNMDVNMMCYRLSEGSWINAGYPLKLHEYLAAGHPIISADLPTVRPFSDVVRIAFGVEDWLAAIHEALTTGGRGSPEQRRAVAAKNGWESRVEVLDGLLAGLVGPEPRAA